MITLHSKVLVPAEDVGIAMPCQIKTQYSCRLLGRSTYFALRGVCLTARYVRFGSNVGTCNSKRGKTNWPCHSTNVASIRIALHKH